MAANSTNRAVDTFPTHATISWLILPPCQRFPPRSAARRADRAGARQPAALHRYP
jgi:hypothetical protein